MGIYTINQIIKSRAELKEKKMKLEAETQLKIKESELEKAKIYERMEKERIEEFRNVVKELQTLVKEMQETRVKDIQVAVRAEEHQRENKENYIKISSKLDRLSDKVEANNLNIQELRVYIQSCPHVRNSVKLDTKEVQNDRK